MCKILPTILVLLLTLGSIAFAAGQWCYDDSDCGYNEYCNYDNKCVPYSDNKSADCCGTYAILLGVIGVGLFVKSRLL